MRTATRTCPLCEATCGLTLTLDGDTLTSVRGDDDDVFSQGFICPKALALTDLERDPDLVRTPLVREGDGFREASWEEALQRVHDGLRPLLDRGDPDVVAIYLGNPNVHNLAGQLYGRVLVRALGTKNIFSASTVDQMPKQVASGLMFGSGASIAVPDVDRTDHLVMLGANPFASNGSLLTAPDLPGRLKAIKARGGTLVVIDPVRTRTAKEATEYHPIVPGTDAHLLAAVVQTLFAESLIAPGGLREHLDGTDDVATLVAPFTPERVAPICGIAPEAICGIARGIAGAERAAVYARIGTCTAEFGTLTQWLVDVINALTGNLDRAGGVMFPKPATGAPNTSGAPGVGRGVRLGRHRSRVSGRPETLGELPVAALAEEILTPGDGQVRALVTLAGNPVVSTPDAGGLRRALADLDFMVSIDLYVNDTTRFADVILPGGSPLTRSHYDVNFYGLSCRNVANYSPAVVPLGDGTLSEWETLLALAAIGAGQGPDADLAAFDEFVAREVLRRGLQNPQSPARGTDEAVAWEAVATRRGPERLLDILLRTGPYGEGFGRDPEGLTLAALEAKPHGIDLGPLTPRIPEMLRTASGKIELAPDPIADDVARLRASLDARRDGGMVLIGRRHLRSNNSWMHNLPSLNGGSNRCTMLIHPDDADRLGVKDGAPATVASSAGTVDVTAEVTPTIMRGVVSIPHGWSEVGEGVRASVAAISATGVNSNVLSPTDLIDPLSGNAVLNGIPVSISP